jgi:membrane-associated phospholipid phosphatase
MIESIDIALFKFINQTLSNGIFDFLMVKFSDKLFWIPFYVLVIFLLTKEYKKKSLLILLAVILSASASDFISSKVFKPMFERTRPCNEVSLTPNVLVNCGNNGSMPSSHAANHFAVAIFFILLYGFKNLKNTVFWFTWAFLIAFSRIYNGVHYPSDVIVGVLLGASIGYIFYKLYIFSSQRLSSKS